MNWTDCTDDGCQIHLGEKQGSGWYPQFTRRSRKPSIAHDQDWQQEMEANPGEDWAPQQQSRQRRTRRVHGDLTSWEHGFNDNCKEHRWEKMDAGYYPRQVGEKGTLSKNDRREQKKRKVVRTRLGGEGSAKTVRRWKQWKHKSRTSEANWTTPPKLLWQKTTTLNDSIRKSKNSNKPAIEPNRGCAKSGVCCGRKEFSIVGPMQEGEGS